MSDADTSPSRPRLVFPVLHACRGRDGLLAAADVAVTADADGVFLIQHGVSTADLSQRLNNSDLMWMLEPLAKRHPRLWVGVNLLGFRPEVAVECFSSELVALLDGVWSDDAGVDARDENKAHDAACRWLRGKANHAWQGLYFGGVAFKTQAEVPADRLGDVARRAVPYVDVVTTSGPATGTPPTVEKVQAMREALGVHPLAVASGVTPENVGDLLPYVDAFLVATGIESAPGVLDPARTRALVDRVHAYVPNP